MKLAGKKNTELKPNISVEVSSIRSYLAEHNPDAFMSFISHGHEFDSPINLFIAEYLGNEYVEALMAAVKQTKSGDIVYQESGRDDFPNIIFAVMPIWDTALSNEEKYLSRCYRNVIDLAKQKSLKNLVIPALGKGKSNFPHKKVVRLSLSAITAGLSAPIEDVVIVCAEEVMFNAYKDRMQLLGLSR